MRRSLIPAFFAVSACSWMPHWACHYYRLETHSSFRVGSWDFTQTDSIVAMTVYALVIIANLAAVAIPHLRMPVALTSGALHLGFAALHAMRVARPFRFEVFGYPWSIAASVRETFIVGLFGLFSILVGLRVRALS